MKNILLTGAQGGIGMAIARTFTEANVQVIAVERAQANLLQYEDIQKLKEKIASEGITLDWLVFAHGFIGAEIDFEKQRREDIEATFQLNIVSIVHLAQIFLKHLRPGGGMIFLSSTAALSPNGRYAVYSASKAAVNAFAQALARNRPELTIYSVCPGPTNTAMRIKIGDTSMKSQSPGIVASLVKRLIQGTTPYKSGDIIALRDGAETRVSGI